MFFSGYNVISRLFLPLFLLTTFGANESKAQNVREPVISLSMSKTQVKVGEELELIFKGDEIPLTWYVYGNDFDPDLGPQAFSLYFDNSKGIQVVGKPRCIGAKKKYSEDWGADVDVFKDKFEVRQTIRILAAKPEIKVEIVAQMCSDVSGICIQFPKKYPSDVEFKGLTVTGGAKTLGDQDPGAPQLVTVTPTVILDSPVFVTKDTVPATADTQHQVIDDGKCHPKKFTDEEGVVHDESKEENLWIFALFAFIGGLAGLLTPCVFPMIPMTVTFFLKSSTGKKRGKMNGIIYGLFIIGIYTIIGTIFSLIFGATGANKFATNAVVNIIFFLVFVIFAISFFGAFEITLPSRFVNKIDKQSDKGGLIGIFFMAFTLVLVSFSCTGPIVGSILVEAAQGHVVRPIVGMLGFSLAFALPFSLFAIFPNWLNSLPKSGGWLNSVKVVLGFAELALGLKFLSVADQVYHWHILDREIYIGLWIVLAALCGLYLLGKLRFAHDSELKILSIPRLFFAIASFSFVFYLIPGLFGAALPGLAGYLPPTTTHGFNIPGMIMGNQTGNVCEQPKYATFLHLPHGLKGYFEYEQALKCAKELKKPLFIDFTGHGCVNCRKMEDKVWANPEVLKMLREDFVLAALYVDDRTIADSSDWRVSKYDGQLKKQIGDINSDIQICDFDRISQPWYVLLDNNGELLATPQATEEFSVEVFLKFLQTGKKNFDRRIKEKQKAS